MGIASTTSAPSWCFFTGLALRVFLFLAPAVTRWLSGRVELNTAVNSWKRVIEAVALDKAGISPYGSDVFHEAPLMLLLYKSMIKWLGSYVNAVFVLTDVLTAIVLEKSARLFARYMLVKQEKEAKSYDKEESHHLTIKAQDMMRVKNYVLAFYLLNPYTIAACVAKSTCVFTNLSLSLTLLFTLQGRRPWAAFWCAVATYQCVYTATLIVPVAAFFVSVDQKHNRPLIFFATSQRRRVLNTCAHAIGVFVAAIAVLLFASRQLTGTWHFLYSTYGFHLTYPDMTPNVGMFWYFFIEIFDHFRVFFLWVFQMNAFFYVVPFAMLFREHPVAMFHSLLAMAAIFKPYPTYADAGLWMSLLPMWYFVYPFMRTILPSIGVLVSTFVLSPILWHLWIMAGSANSNFYFATTLAFNSAQMFLLTDLVYALNKRMFFLRNGFRNEDEAGKKMIVLLK